MFKRKGIWLLVGVLLLLGGAGGYFYYATNFVVEAAEDEQQEVQTAVSRTGDIVVSAVGAGTIVAAEEIELSFGSGGTLTELLVRVGDDVAAGDLLARLDETVVQQALLDAELQLTKALMQSDGSTTEVGLSYDEINLTQAEINLAEAQADLEALLTWQPDADEIAQAESILGVAQASLSAAQGNAASTGYSLELEAISLQQAQDDLTNALVAYETAFDPGREWELYSNDPSCSAGQQYPNCTGQPYSTRLENERTQAENAVTRAEANLEIVQIQYNQTIATSSSSNVASAQSSLLSAELALATAQEGPTTEQIQAAETAVRQAELALQQVRLNQEANQLDLLQAERNLAEVEAALGDVVLIAPIDGTITAVNFSVGETVNGNMMVLADLTQPLLELFLDESDLAMVGNGFEVEVTFDALPDETFVGTVIQVDPELTTTGGITAIRALVQLDLDSFSKPQTLPIGLNATVEVIGGRAEGAVIVPVEALREVIPGQFSLFVLEDGEPRLRNVEVGIMDFSFAEITAGLEAGEEVTTGIVQTQ